IYSFYPQKSIGYRSPGVSRGGYENSDLPQSALANKISQGSRHEPGAYIFKSQGGTAKQLQDRNILLQRHHWNLKAQGVFNDLHTYLLRDLIADITFYSFHGHHYPAAF